MGGVDAPDSGGFIAAMLQGLSQEARLARAWPFEQARALLNRVLRVRLDDDADRALAAELIASGQAAEAVARLPALIKRPVVLETGYGPSGLPHIGTFNEVARTTYVRNAFRALTDDRIPTVLYCFSDDMDGLRKVPDNVPNQAMLTEDLGKPLTVVRDPFGEHDSFGRHNNARLRAFLDQYGFDYEFLSATDCYRSGRFDPTLLTALARFDAIQAIILPTLGPERRATYSPFLPVSPSNGQVLQVPTLARDVAAGTITFEDADGAQVTTPIIGGAVKLQWKPDWAMRWTTLGVDYEMAGKDLIESVKQSGRICRALGGEPPEGFNYELFLDEAGQKISKSKGNGLTIEEWLRYAPPETLAYYIYLSPKSAKRLSWDVIPRAVDDYLGQIEAYARQDAAQRLENPVWHVHNGQPPAHTSPVSFALLLNLVSAGACDSEQVLWRYLRRRLPDATPESEPMLARLIDPAIRYYADFVAARRQFRDPDARERGAMTDLVARFRALSPEQRADAEAIQYEVYEVGKAHGFEPLRAWFQGLYEVLLGSSQGPRFGGFAALYGVDETIALIERRLRGEAA